MLNCQLPDRLAGGREEPPPEEVPPHAVSITMADSNNGNKHFTLALLKDGETNPRLVGHNVGFLVNICMAVSILES
jgi:hypothetical protein